MMLRILLAVLLVPCLAFAGNVKLDITGTTNQTANAKLLYRSSTGSYPDTSSVGWASPGVDHTSTYDTGIPAAVASADSGGIVVNWTAATGHDGYRLDFNPNDEGWESIASPAVGATSYTHEITDVVKPRRGEIDYRLRSWVYDAPDTVWSAVSILPAQFLNQAVKVMVTMHVSDGDETVASPEQSWVFRSSYTEPADPPPSIPSGFMAIGGEDIVTLAWNANSEPDFASYTVYRGLFSGSVTEYQAGITSVSYVDNAAAYGTTYFYQLSAIDDGGNESVLTGEITGTPSSTAPASGPPGSPTHHWDSMTSDEMTLTGDVITAWDDKVGDWDWVQYGTGVTGPFYRAADQLNGHTAAYFDGSSWLRRTVGFIGAADYTICMVFRVDGIDNGGAYTGLWNEGVSHNPTVAPLYWNSSFPDAYIRQGGGLAASTKVATMGYHTWVVSYNSAAGEVSAWLDGAQILTNSSGAADYSSATRAVIGGMWYGEPDYSMVGIISEIVIYPTTSDNASAGAVDTYFERWD